MSHKQFLYDTHARIPFSLIGIILILGSSIASVSLTRLEVQRSTDIARTLDFDEVSLLLHSAESDMATALNIAGMKALKDIGKTPVVTSALGEPEQINELRVKLEIQAYLSMYLTGHFLDDTYTDGRYALNVVLHNQTPIPTADLITITSIQMNLERTSIPFIGPRSERDCPVYWAASVPIDIEINDLTSPACPLMSQTINITSILTSRYPLLASLTEEFHDTINGTFSPLWTFSTIVSNIYSLVRGYKHYQTGLPRNIVDNHHLAFLINSGLLLEQGLVFSSVDPVGIIELAREAKTLISQQTVDPITVLNQDMTGEGYEVEPLNLSQQTANLEAGDPVDAPLDDGFSLNLSDIAQGIMYNITGVTLQFENELGDLFEVYVVYDENAQDVIRETIQELANQSYTLTNVIKTLQPNTLVCQQLSDLASRVYHDDLCTRVASRLITGHVSGDPGEGWTDGGAGPWTEKEVFSGPKRVVKPEVGDVVAGCALYEEMYNITYQCTHTWYTYIPEEINGSVIMVEYWNNMTDTETETVTLQVVLSGYAGYNETANDVIDVLYYNQTLDDSNLEDTLSAYLSFYPDSNPLKQQFLEERGNEGTCGLEADVPGEVPSWVFGESWEACDEILELLTKITPDPTLTASRYPSPILLVQKTAEDLQEKLRNQTVVLLNHSCYEADSVFFSVGKKSVFFSREWFVQELFIRLDADLAMILDALQTAVDTEIPSDAGCTMENVTEALNGTMDAVRNQFTIPFGVDMTLIRSDDYGEQLWNETVRLGVDTDPHYLDPYETTVYDGEELWTMKLRNRCVFGPTGLPILPPTPVTPWLLTVNLWVIDVQGEYAHVKIIDSSDETIFNPILGHEAQVYVRESRVVTESSVILGENTRLSFGFSTLAFGVVPPWGMMIGDLQLDWYDDHTPGFAGE